MKFYELLNKYSNEEIIDGLKLNYEDVNENAYLRALNELRILLPSKAIQDLKINVELKVDDFDEGDDTKYLECDGVGLDDEDNLITFGIEFTRWEEWLAKDINEECLDKLSELTILVGIMWELTYNGYTQEQVDTKREDLLNRSKEAEEHPENLVKFDLEELKNKLKENKGKDIFIIKECCLNCHYYLSSYENCQGMKDLESTCFEYKQNMNKDENDESLWVKRID